MENRERRLKIKLTGELGKSIKEILGVNEIYIKAEESKELYKKLSTSDSIEDWDWEDVTDEPQKKEEPVGKFSTDVGLSKNMTEVTIIAPNEPINLQEAIDKLNIKSLDKLLDLIIAAWGVSRDFPDITPSGDCNMVIDRFCNGRGPQVMGFDRMASMTYLNSKFKDLQDAIYTTTEALVKNWNHLSTSDSIFTVLGCLYC